MTTVILFYTFIFIIGAAVGSFLGVVVDRIRGSESIWKGRSHCDHCRRKLAWNDLIPVASFFVLNQKCRYCHEPLSWFYPLIEILTGAAFVLTAYSIFKASWFLIGNPNYIFLLAYYFFLVASLIAIFFADIKYGIIPFKIVIFATALTLVWYLLFPSLYFLPIEISILGIQTNILSALGAGVGAGGFFFLLFLLTKGKGMGFGDVVYAFLLGIILGFPNVILALYIAFLTGALIALILVVTKKKKFRGGTIPFGPFLVFGTFVSLLWGSILIKYILSFFVL